LLFCHILNFMLIMAVVRWLWELCGSCSLYLRCKLPTLRATALGDHPTMYWGFPSETAVWLCLAGMASLRNLSLTSFIFRVTISMTLQLIVLKVVGLFAWRLVPLFASLPSFGLQVVCTRTLWMCEQTVATSRVCGRHYTRCIHSVKVSVLIDQSSINKHQNNIIQGTRWFSYTARSSDTSANQPDYMMAYPSRQ
jgi:hypothetical protein